MQSPALDMGHILSKGPYHIDYMIWTIRYGCSETTMITVPRWFESSMAHEAAVHHFLFWSFARYRFRKSAKCFFGTMGKNFEMIFKSFFSVWLSKDDYYKSTSWNLCGPRLDRSVCRTLIQSSFLKIANTLPGAKPTRTNHIIIYGWNIKSWTRLWFMVSLAGLLVWPAGVRGTVLSSPDGQSHVQDHSILN